METIQCKIILLPKEIQDIIYGFNVEHRDNMKPVFRVIRNLGRSCFICGEYLYDKPDEVVVYIMKRIITCSKKCEIIAFEELDMYHNK